MKYKFLCLLLIILLPLNACILHHATSEEIQALQIASEIPLPDPGLDPQTGDKFIFSSKRIDALRDTTSIFAKKSNQPNYYTIWVIAGNPKYQQTAQVSRVQYNLVIPDYFGPGTQATSFTVSELQQYHDFLTWKVQSKYP